MEEKKYPIYNISVRWNQDDYQGNCSGYKKMYKDDPGLIQVTKEALDWWNEYIKKEPHTKGDKKLIDKHPQLLSIEVKFIGCETWCILWFSHYTYNTELTDEELLRSFQKFVDRKLPLQENLEHNVPNSETYCLMGAEDNWRWKGPCRCEHCQKAGIVSIDH